MKITHEQVEYYLPKGISPRAQQRRLLDTPEPELVAWVEKYLKKHSGAIIHAGAFSGDLLPQLCDSATYVYAWEPVSYNYKTACKTIKLNNLKNINLRNSALSNSTGTISIVTQFDGGYRLGGLCSVFDKEVVSPLLKQAEKPITESVLCETIDNYTYKDLKIIHLDLEGWELPVLQGAESTVNKYRPIIIIEDTEHTCDKLLKQWNYTYLETVSGDRVYTP